MKNKKGYTLAEILITITILGVIAAITLPSLMKQYTENANKAKLKKAMNAYEKVFNKVIIENDIVSMAELRGRKGFASEGNCVTNILPYFKVSQQIDNTCKFRASDGLWWNITNFENPIVSFKEENLTEEKANDLSTNDAFSFHGEINANDGILRINDYNYEQQSGKLDNYVRMVKLWNYLNNKLTTMNGTIEECRNAGAYECVLKDKNVPYRKFKGLDIYVSELQPKSKLKYTDAISEENCKDSVYSNCSTEGDYFELIKRECISQGGHMPSKAELESMHSADSTYSVSRAVITDPYHDNDDMCYSIPMHASWGMNVMYGNYKNKAQDFICISDN